MESKLKAPAEMTKSMEVIKAFMYEDFIKNDYTVREALVIIGCIAGHIISTTPRYGADPEEFKQCLFKTVEAYLKD
jgi:hypothetical protein